MGLTVQETSTSLKVFELNVQALAQTYDKHTWTGKVFQMMEAATGNEQ